jgi:signal transduction histidine kinase
MRRFGWRWSEVTMRLGIRRKLIGTLILVGLFPLALSLIIILVGGAAMRLTSIKNDYEHLAYDCSSQIASSVKREVDQLDLVARLSTVTAFVRDQNVKRHLRDTPESPHPAGAPSNFASQQETRWSVLKDTDPPLRDILQNPIAERLRLISQLNSQQWRQLVATDEAGEAIAADSKPTGFYYAGQAWWKGATTGPRGRIYVSTVFTDERDGRTCIVVAVPIVDELTHKVIGVIRDKLELDFLRDPFQYALERREVRGQLFDTTLDRTIVAHGEAADEVERAKAEAAYRRERTAGTSGLVHQFFADLVIGSAPVPFDRVLPSDFTEMEYPNWVVIVSKPAQAAMTPVYHLALTVAGIGVALIVALFVLGVAISNREIIFPIVRLREAVAAVGRGELNIRVTSSDAAADSTFRADEIGDLAHDFDEMTRQLQKNVSQLERSNEAKRRFMELAGHELRTPVTYILGVCQLLQRQVQLAQKAEEDSGTGSTATARSTAAMQGAVTKIIAKTQRLSRIIENLLKLVNNDQFTTRMIRQPIDMRALILQVCNDNRPFVLERKQQMQIDIPENLLPFEGDRDKLEDVLTNLISNAIRFSPDHSTIKVGARKVVGDMLEIIIEDAGPGIPQADLTNLFEPFYTGTDIMHHHSGTFEFGSKGIGLGLAIVRRFVEIHGGIVQAHATGHGTQFKILLPLMQGTAPDTAVAKGDGI